MLTVNYIVSPGSMPRGKIGGLWYSVPMKQLMDGMGQERQARRQAGSQARRLAPGEIARLRAHVEALAEAHAEAASVTRAEALAEAHAEALAEAHAEAASEARPVRSEPMRPARPATPARPAQDGRPTVPTRSAPSARPTVPTRPNRPARPARPNRWRAGGSVLAGLVGLALLVGGISAGQADITAGRVLGTSAAATAATARPRTTPMPVLDTALAEQQELQGLADDFAATEPAPFYIFIKDLKTGAVARHQADTALASASLYKLFVAERIYSLIDQNQLKPSQSATGTKLDVADCLNRMIVVSDNDCGYSLGSTLGWGSQNSILKMVGYSHTDLAQPQQTSPSDVGLLLERLYRGQLNTPASDGAFIQLLKSQIYADRLRAGIPAGTVVADKTGNLDGYVHDAGIVYGPRTDYVIAVMSGSWTAPGVAPAQISALSAKIWGYLEN